jgi:hypothetical protein
MNMQSHILAAMRELFEQWEALFGRLSEAQLAAPLEPSDGSIQDVTAHLWVWLQRTLARSEAARLGLEPDFPNWPVLLDPDGEGGAEPVNAWIYATYHGRPWDELHMAWRASFLRLLESADQVSERDLLDGDRYAWLEGWSLAQVLIASYDHHREHLDAVQTWLREHGQEV